MAARPEPTISRRNVLRLLGAGAATALVPAAAADMTARQLSVESHTLTLPRWDADGFRVALIADLHSNRTSDMERARQAVQMAVDSKPDLIAIPGDFVDSSSKLVLANLDLALEPLHDATCPVIATLGNHDYGAWKPQRTIAAIRKNPLTLLRNEPFEVQGVTVAGVDDGSFGHDDPAFINDHRHSKSLLVLFHEPDYVERIPNHASLQLSGHSHGGQICLPGGRPIHTPSGAQKYIAGYYPNATIPLFVTRGVGTTGPDWRLFCRPEVTLLTLRGA